MPAVESMKATVVLEFDISTTASGAVTLAKVEQIIDPILDYRGDIRAHVDIREIKIRSMTIEPKNA